MINNLFIIVKRKVDPGSQRPSQATRKYFFSCSEISKMVGTQPRARFPDVTNPWTARLWQKDYKKWAKARKREKIVLV